MTAFLVALCALVGLLVGSFLNVVIWRVPRKESVVSPPSHCPQCDTPISPRDNIPVVSWLLLRGKCRNCGAKIGIRYPAIELTNAVLWGAVAGRIGYHAALPGFLLFTAMLVAVTVIDLDHFLIPNRVIYPTLFATIPLMVAAAFVDDRGLHHLGRAAIGGAAGFAALFVINFVYPAGMGFGDVRLAGVMGIYLGWLSLGHLFLALFLSFLLASVVGILLIALKIRGRKDPIPFGPFLAAAGLIAVLFGTPLLHWYAGA